MRIKVGESVSSGGGNQKGAKIVAPEAAVDESGNTKRRILIVAPSNAAVDELVTRLVMNGVPGSDGDAFFPNVVRVGGSRVGDPDDQRDTGREGTRQRMSSLVQVGYQPGYIVRCTLVNARYIPLGQSWYLIVTL